MKKVVILIGFLTLLWNCSGRNTESNILDEMKIFVPVVANRPVSFTNKEAAYYYTQSHENNHDEWAWFEGLNIAKKKMFQGYEIFAGEKPLDNLQAEVWVYPYKMVRLHPCGLIEQLWMFDDQNVLEVSLSKGSGNIGIRLKGDEVNFLKVSDNIAYFHSMEGEKIIGVAPKYCQDIHVKNRVVSTGWKADGFLIAAGKNETEAAQLIRDNRKSNETLKSLRKKRMRKLLLKHAWLKCDNDSLQLASNWLNITLDQLVTKQQGYGIYAGLPWFNEYWGRDQFIALPGACLVTGRFEVARKILLSFAEYQETNENSKFFGRVPNIVNPENIDYHTTDGTPRFVIQLQEYVKYSGDTTIIKELYDNVKYSIEGSLQNWTDDKNYLIHADNETWMDARRASDLKPYSPRGNRANDIQALWYGQLLAGVYFADFMEDSVRTEKWREVARQLKINFQRDFTDEKYDYLADRLTEKGEKDFRIRPNQLFALDLIDNQSLKWKTLKKCWEELVYPWGVASLNRQDDFFHPYHKSWQNYHKDEAYHNGTIWLWNNGIAMQRMIEAGQTETAYKLFKNMNSQALNRGCVGGMCENMDAYPHSGKSWPGITGTYLQAWSNTEHLRVWYQYFLGIQPDMINNILTLAPRIPEELQELSYNFYIGRGYVAAAYHKGEKEEYRFHNIDIQIKIDIYPFESVKIDVEDGDFLILQRKKERLDLILKSAGKDKPRLITLPVSSKQKELQDKTDEIFQKVSFCKPLNIKTHTVMEQKYNRE